MRTISPTIAAVFLAGVCVGSFGNQLLATLRTAARPKATLDVAPDRFELSGLAPVVNRQGLDADLLAELRAKNGSVLAGTALETAVDDDSSAPLADSPSAEQHGASESDSLPEPLKE